MTGAVPWATWKPIYEAIRMDFDYEQARDEAARDALARLCQDRVLGLDDLPTARGRTVGVAGGASTLRSDVDELETADLVFAASTATEVLAEVGVDVDVHVTDLDKDEETTVGRSNAGQPVALHAHGDNRSALERHVPRMDTRFLLPTTQVEPVGDVVNVGGFTDGDRAAFLADALGADRLVFAGWAFEDPSVSREKRRKLHWAARLLHWLERRRNERFDVLSTVRTDLEVSQLPDPRHD